MNYPIFLTNMNRLSTTKKMVEDLFRMNGNADITIIDNASTYPPLLEWYKQVEGSIKIIRNKENKGPWVFFYGGVSLNVKSDYYIYSDADLELNPNMPYNWQEIMFEYIKKYDRKASLALRISDIIGEELLKKIKNHQSICWYPTEEKDVYKAITDMTFSMDSKKKGYRYESIRLAGDFECRHIPWYIDVNNLSDEDKYYLDHIDDKYPDALWSNMLKRERTFKCS